MACLQHGTHHHHQSSQDKDVSDSNAEREDSLSLARNLPSRIISYRCLVAGLALR